MHVTLSYKDKNQYSNVYLNGTIIGYIMCRIGDGGWFYTAKGKSSQSRNFSDRRAVKEALGEKMQGVVQAHGLDPEIVKNELSENI